MTDSNQTSKLIHPSCRYTRVMSWWEWSLGHYAWKISYIAQTKFSCMQMVFYTWVCLCWPFCKNLDQLCVDTECSLEDMPQVMDRLQESQGTPCYLCPVGWGCRIHQLLLCRGVRHPPTTNILDMTLSNLTERFQECRVPFHYHHS